jgi:phosphohistidine phosphatase SixA
MGGHVLLIRHERTNAFIPDRDDYQVENCASQRNLSIAGAANAVENGGVIRFLDIPMGEILASPMCRTLETARLLFGDVAVFDVEDGAARHLGTIPANAWNDAVIDASIRVENHNHE